jgi:hypothetical protein
MYMIRDDDKTPSQRHKDFALEIIALARKHKMNSITCSFRNSHTLPREYDQDYSGIVKISWSEGRHGSKSAIRVNFEGSMEFNEDLSDGN